MISSVRKDHEGKLIYFLIFLLPIVLLIFALNVIRITENGFLPPAITLRDGPFDTNFFSSCDFDLKLVKSSPDIRTILRYGMDPAIIIGLLFNSSVGINFFRVFFYIRFGLMGLCAFFMCKRTLRIKDGYSVFLSVAYALSSVALECAQSRQITDMMIMLPLEIYAIDNAVRNCRSIYSIRLSVFTAMLMMTGAPAISSGLPVVILSTVLISLSAKPLRKTVIRLIISIVFGIAGAMIVILPLMASLETGVSFADKIRNSDMSYKLFDLISGMTEGKIISSSVLPGIPSVSMGTGILLFVLLFFINDRIPFGMKTVTGASAILSYAAISWTAIGKFYAPLLTETEYLFSVIGAWAAVLLFISGIAIVNIKNTSTDSIWLSCVFVLAVVTISHSSANEVAPNTFSLIFTWVAVAVWGIVLQRGQHDAVLSCPVLLVVLAGFMINLIFTLAPGSFTEGSLLGYGNAGEKSGLEIYLAEPVKMPLLGEDKSYLFLSSDISEYEGAMTPPEIINACVNAALLEDLFAEVQTSDIYSDGATYMGFGRYDAGSDSGRAEMIIRADKGMMIKRCFVQSGFEGAQNLTEIYDQEDRVQIFGNAFFAEIVPLEREFDLRLAVNEANAGTHEFKVWVMDDSVREEMENKVRYFEGDVIETDDRLLSFEGRKSIITSIPYSRYIKAEGNVGNIRCFDVLGKTAVAFDCKEGTTEARLRIYDSRSDVTAGLISTAAVIITNAFILANIYYNRRNKPTAEGVQKDC